MLSAGHDICLSGRWHNETGAPPFEIGVVDVRDVAEAHIRAAFISGASGRHIVSKELHTTKTSKMPRQIWKTIHYPKELPKWLVWLVGPFLDKTMTRKIISENIG